MVAVYYLMDTNAKILKIYFNVPFEKHTNWKKCSLF